MKPKILLLFTLFSSIISPYAQTLPSEMRLSNDGRLLLIGDQPNTGLYDQSEIKTIYLEFSQSNYWTLLLNNYMTHTDLLATMIVNGVTYDSVGVRFRGQTSYMGTSGSQKKSFNITLDFVKPGQDIMGYKTLNLNNCFQDESFIREIFYQHQIKKHIPTAKSAYIKLYINGNNWGLYPNVQQLNKDFLEEWYLSNDGTNWRADRPSGGGSPGWGDGTAALNYLGPDTSTYQTYYTLKSTEKLNPWEDLVNTCDILENTPIANLPVVLPNVLDVDRTLWFLASEVLFADDDSYIHKGKMDYYVHWEKETGRTVPQEYDGNSVMDPSHQNWSPFYNENDPNYPLLNRLLAVPRYRQRYLAHLRTLMTELFDTDSAYALIDHYKTMIDSLVQDDPKKLYTYTQFNNEIPVLKNFIANRKTTLNGNSEFTQPVPTITNVAYYTNGTAWAPPVSMQATTVRANAAFTTGIFRMNLYYSNVLTGNFSEIQMFDDGAHDDGASGDGLYGAQIPGHAGGSWMRFYVEAIANNPARSVKYDPVGAEHNVYVYIVAPDISPDTAVVINEIMASNSSGAIDEAGQYADWIELHNKSSVAVNIGGYFLTDNPANLDKWQIPDGTMIPPSGYLIIWADEDSSQGPLHANFKLAASGEKLYFLDLNGAMVDTVRWGLQETDMGYARVPNGYGDFVIQSPTFSANNDPSGIAEYGQQDVFISVYPNPASDRMKIIADKWTAQEINIMNAVGRTMFIGTVEKELEVNTSDWAAGFYIVQCGESSKKLMIWR